MPILTFVTPNPMPDFDLWIKKSHPYIEIEDRQILDVDRAVQWHVNEPISKAILDAIRAEFRIDVFQRDDATDIKLFMADMDATIVVGETLDDMAAKIGIGEQISAITARAMRGELDFEEALLARVRLLEGQSVSIIDECVAEIKLNAGATQLLSHLKSNNAYCVLISGGFTQFISAVAEQLGFDDNFGNELIIEDNVITGDVARPILDKNFKRQKMDDLMQSMSLSPDNVMAIGDGANDLPMLQRAGLGIGYYPKSILQDNLINQIRYTDLSSLCYLV